MMNIHVYIFIVRYVLKMNLFIFICALCNCISEQYLQQAMYAHPCIENLYSIFFSKSDTVIRNLACYLYQAFRFIENTF